MRKFYSVLPALFICTLGFSQNPQMLKDIFPGNNSGSIQHIVKTSSYIFFNEDDDDADTDRSLFRTDGTTAGTIKLNLVYPGYISTKAEKLTALDNKVVFAGDNFTNYGEIWSSDGTQAGTVALERFLPNSNRIPVVEISAMGSYAYYSVIDKDAGGINRAYLRRTDGTAAGTSLVYDFSAFTGVPQVVFLKPVNNILYFIVYDQGGTGVDQLWRSDGTAAGTYIVYNFTTANFVESFIMPAGNTMYIMIGSIVGGIRQNTIWKSDGTTAGTVPVKLIGTGNSNTYPPFAAIGSTLYFAGVDANGKELWKTDGTVAGTVMVADINSGGGNSVPSFLTAFNNNLFFAAENPTYGGELWKYDGSVATLVKDINPGNAASIPQGFVASGNSLIFSAVNNTTGRELWITDGSSANTVMIADINPGAASGSPNTFTPGNTVYFAASNGINGFEVFKYENNDDAIGGPIKFYVNDNNITGDLLTLGIGNNSNNGSKLYPFATISYAVTHATEGDTIYVDAGTYAEQVTIDKGITIIGAGQDLTSVVNPVSALVPAPGPFVEYGLIQTTQGIGDVHISNITATNSPSGNGHTIMIQSGGSVKFCKLVNGGQGVFFRVESAVKTAHIEYNTIQPAFIGINCQGSGLTTFIQSNNITSASGFYSAVFAGLDFGPLPQLTITNNTINNYGLFGGPALLVSSYNGNYNNNSIVGTGPIAIERYSGSGNRPNATCNWYGTSDQYAVAAKINGAINFSPWLVNGTDNDPSSIGFQPVPGSCAGRQLFYVNDNSLTGDVYSSAVGNNANNGSSPAPLATITAALAKAQAGDIILVDAGNYTEQVNINKAITIKGAGKTLTFINGPAAPIAALPDWGEKGIIQSIAGIGDVIIEDLLIDGTNSDEQHSIMIQGGGRVSNCEMRNANNGFFFRHISTQPRLAIAYNNYIHNISFVGILFAGNGLSAEAYSNVIDLNGAISGMGFLSGWGGDGNVASLIATNNSIINFNGFGMMIGSIQTAQVHNNSITRLTGNYIQNVHTVNVDASCNWYGTTEAAVIISNMTGSVTNSPWLTNGTDNDIAFGFQPVANACNGRQNKFYVNDNSLTNDVFTTAVGNDANTGIPSAPLATMATAFSRASAGDSIFVDAGTYATPDITLNKAITILGTNYLINPNEATDALLPNASRNAETIITGSRFTIGANNIKVEGLTLDPGSKTAILLSNASFSNFKFSNNKSILNSGNFISLTGTAIASPAIPAATGFDFINNRFEKLGTGSGITFFVNYVNYLNIDKNSFVVTGPIPRTQITSALGQSGLVYDVRFTDNVVDKPSYYMFTFQISQAVISGNKLYNGNNGLFIQDTYAGSSDIRIENNYMESSMSASSLLTCRFFGGNNAASSTVGKIRNNTININGTGLTFVPAAIATQMPGLALNPSFEINGNKITHTGNYNLFTSSNVTGISVNGKLENTTVINNEATFTGTNLVSPNPVNPAALFTAAIVFATDGGTTNATPAGSIINVQNNKLSGYKQSIALFDGIALAPNAYTGYGNVPAGVTFNINNNSFTGDSISVNNGTIGQAVNATCNWYGTPTAQGVFAKITPSTVNYIPWLTSGADNDILTTGFQPAGACDGTPAVVTLDAGTNVTCFGVNNGIINISVSGGFTPYIYSWTKDEDPEFASAASDLTGLAPGTYYLTVTDANGSIAQLEVTINEPPLLTASASGTNNVCFGESNGSASILAEGGTAPYSYLWSNGVTTDEIANLAAGIYSVTVTDANGCTTSANYEVTQPTQILLVITNTSTACANSATVVVTGGTGDYAYLWSNGSTVNSIGSVPAGTYTLDVTDENGCTVSAQITLAVNEGFNPSASVQDVSCFGGNNGVITITNVNGTAPFQYSIDGLTFQSSNVFNGLVGGIYTITVVDANGCVGFVTKTIEQPTELVATLGTVQNTCFSQSTGSINASVSGGSPSYNYSWSGPGGYSSTQLNLSNLATGTYTLTVTDNKGCTDVINAVVNHYPQILFSSSANNIACKGTLTGSINLSLGGGTGSGFTYLWSGPNGMIATSEDLINLGTGNYNVIVTDIGSGCTVSGNYTITQPANAVNLSAVSTNAAGCNSLGSITVTGSGGTAPYQYSINGVNYLSSPLFSGLYAGSYTVWVKDANGCTKSLVKSVTDNGQDEFESNNSKNQAKTINLSATNNARIATAGDAADWFKFTTTSAGSYTLVLTHPSATFTYNMYASGNNTPALTPTSTTTTTKVYALAASTTYYISVTGGLSYVCYQISVSPTSFLTKSSGATNQQTVHKQIRRVDVFNVSAFPNPSASYFNITIETSKDEKANLRVMDITGRLIEERKNIAPNEIVRFGDRYINGVYLVEVIQGTNRKTLRLVKM